MKTNDSYTFLKSDYDSVVNTDLVTVLGVQDLMYIVCL